MNQYVALLRGINVGGKNIIKMADLRTCFKAMGFDQVRTYIQSGNVLFHSEETGRDALVSRIEKALADTFNYQLPVVVRSDKEMAAIVTNAPAGFGQEPDAYRYDVIFLKEPLTAAEAIPHLSPREGVDQLHPGEGTLYASRLISRVTQSRLSRIASSPIYQSITIRNWNTTTKLLNMMTN